MFFFFKQKTAYDMRISDWSSDVCSSDLTTRKRAHVADLNKRATETDLRLKRLFDAIENGIADVNDPDLKERIATLKATRDQAKADAERVAASLGAAGRRAVAPDMLAEFAPTARQRRRIEGERTRVGEGKRVSGSVS